MRENSLLSIALTGGLMAATAARAASVQPLAGSYSLNSTQTGGNCAPNLAFVQLYYSGPTQTGSQAFRIASPGPGNTFFANLNRAPIAGQTHWSGQMKWIMSPGAVPIQVHFAGDFTFFDQRLFFLRLKYMIPTGGGAFCSMTSENVAVWTGN